MNFPNLIFSGLLWARYIKLAQDRIHGLTSIWISEFSYYAVSIAYWTHYHHLLLSLFSKSLSNVWRITRILLWTLAVT